MRRALAVAAFLWGAVAPTALAQEPAGLPLHGEAAETFLKTARVVKTRGLKSGITGSDQLTLSDGEQTHKAVWKTIDELHRGVTKFDNGIVMVDYEDSYRFEIAAYELDKLLGLDLVPPTVERAIGSRTGSVQLWIESATTEGERKKKGLRPPDQEAWNRQIHTVRLLHQLTFNWDAQNINNVLFDPSFRVYAIDFSRSFAVYDDLRDPKLLQRFPRGALEAMKRLDEATLDSRMGRFISHSQMRALLKRRDRILELAAKRIAEKGEATVVY
jgi:hypothetical protein